MESIDEIIEELRVASNPACSGIETDECNKFDTCKEHRLTLIDAIEDELTEMKDFIDRLHEAADKREDVTLFGVEYIACLLDAEGRMCRIGDLAQSVAFPTAKPKKVCGFGTINGKPVVFYVTESGDGHFSEMHNGWDYAESVRLYHAPTVEDVLREFYSRYCITKPKKEDDAILAEYAAKLRLAGDSE